MKILVIGYGSIGKRHIENLLSMANVEILICSKNKIIVSPKISNCKIFTNILDALKENPDAALITNVTSLHIPTALKLAKHGIDIFIEKPLSNSTKEISQLLKLIKKKHIITQMGCNYRFHKCIQEIKKIISRNEVGRIISVHVENGSYLPEWHPWEDYRKSYAGSKDLGGGVVLTCIHEIDYLYWFFGEVEEVFSMTGKQSDLEITVDDLSSILLRFKNGVIAEVHLDFFQRPNFRSCKIIGTKGTIYWDSDTNAVKMYHIQKKRWIEKIKVKNYDYNNMYVDELTHFIKCVVRRRETINNIYQGLKTLEIALGVLKSSKIKRVVKI